MAENIFLLRNVSKTVPENKNYYHQWPTLFDKFLKDRKQMRSDKWSRKAMKYLQETSRVDLLRRREWTEESLGQLTK
jgi:hypothetical protein